MKIYIFNFQFVRLQMWPSGPAKVGAAQQLSATAAIICVMLDNKSEQSCNNWNWES